MGNVTGAWAILTGLIQIGGALRSRRDATVSTSGSLLFGMGGAATSALGTLILFQPWIGFVSQITLLAGAGLNTGVSHLALGLYIRQFLRQSTPPAEWTGFQRSA